MSTVIELPDGQNATLRDNAELSNKQVKELRRAARTVSVVGQKLRELGIDEVRADEATTTANNQRAMEILTHLSDEEDDSLDLFQRTCVAIRIIDWTLDLPLPKTPDDVDNLPRPIYAVLTKEAADLDLSDTFDMDGAVDPKAASDSSDGSEQPSSEEPS